VNNSVFLYLPLSRSPNTLASVYGHHHYLAAVVDMQWRHIAWR